MGANHSHCHGTACVQVGSWCALLTSDFQVPPGSYKIANNNNPIGNVFAGSPKSPLFGGLYVGPKGGLSVGSGVFDVSVDGTCPVGDGGAGTCPVLIPVQQSTGAYKAGSPRAVAGNDGKDGASIFYPCSRKGAYTLALQRCPPVREDPVVGRRLRKDPGVPARLREWTLHGLWPAGVSYCSEQPFVLSEIDAELQEALAAKWPSCSGQGEQWTMDNVKFWKYQWEKHGTCTGLAQRSFFVQSLELLTATAANCANVTKAECRLCLTSAFRLCGGLQASDDWNLFG
jgi:hypothetical protein